MPAFKLTVAYDGTNYCGWQIQPNGVTIQEKIEQALSKIGRQPVKAIASGRTDSGVHAIGQVISVQMPIEISAAELQRAINNNIPPEIQITESVIAQDDFHAIRNAVRKRYRYQIQNSERIAIFERNFSWHIRLPLDHELMAKVAKDFIGEHDFASFQAAGSDRKTTIREIYDLSLVRQSCGKITIEVEANGFLYNMVRNIVGTLVEIGQGKHGDLDSAKSWLREVFDARDRKRAGVTAPALGLFLLWVDYDQNSPQRKNSSQRT